MLLINHVMILLKVDSDLVKILGVPYMCTLQLLKLFSSSKVNKPFVIIENLFYHCILY